VQRALIIGGIGVVFLGAAFVMTWANQADQPGVASLTSAISPAERLKAEAPQPVAPAPRATAAAPRGSAAPQGLAAPKPAAAFTPTFDVVRVNPQGSAVIAGRAEPLATVTILDGGRPIGQVTADQRGEWVLLPENPLEPGSRQLSLSAKAPDSAEVRLSQDVVVLVVPGPARDVAGRPAAERYGALALAVPRDGAGPATVLQAPPAPAEKRVASSGNAVPATDAALLPPGSVTVDVIDYGTDGRVNIGGHAPPNARIQVYLDNVLIGHSISTAEGRWGLTPDQPVRPGRYLLRADHVAGDGRVNARAEIPFQMADQASSGLPAGQNIVVQPGASLWRIARRTYGDGVRFSLIYEANQGQIRDPDLIYPGQIFTVPQVN
jgi:nucleoid-associated protein YgaU